MDNIEHNPTPTTSSSSFHETNKSHSNIQALARKANCAIPLVLGTTRQKQFQNFQKNLSSDTRQSQWSTYSKPTTRFTL
ncbi:hypothetical protein DPMN_047701 [Dreissena polymorpha]|uniref:Uncharacterized protein n=1 Tax=Dreissena polymorpha TaxID=45954 RepID=A0A9D4D8I7_DREPO|nr:hypothetical protein DPMN_047701 [Dreissena polymorpha]